jgi:hypothetical protein
VPATAPTAILARWDAWAFADPRAWQDGVPVASLLVATALAVSGLLLAFDRLQRFEP